jgi:hypothetical protein
VIASPRSASAGAGTRAAGIGSAARHWLFLALALLPLPASAQLNIVPAVTTAAGTGNACSPTTYPCGDGAAATAANLNGPQHTFVDNAGNIYISDYANNRVRKIAAATGIITTVAGNGTACPAPQDTCGDGGPATAANLYEPNATYVDASGNIYIADRGDNRIRKVTASSGDISTIVGTGYACTNPTANPACGDNGLATAATLNTPVDITLDSAGNIYIADFDTQRIRKVTASSGNISTIAGTGTGCSNATANPACGDTGLATSASVNSPRGVAVDSAGNVYISDLGDNRIRKITASSGHISTIAGNGYTCAAPADACGDGGAATSSNLTNQGAISLDSAGNVYIADQSDNRIRKVTVSSGIITTVAGTGSTCSAQTNPCGDGAAAASAQFNYPTAVFVDNSDNLYVSDSGNNRIRRVALILNFPETAIGSSAAQNVLLETTAAETLTGFTAQTSVGSKQEFTIGTISGCTIGSSNAIDTVCTLPITFSPAYPGMRKVQLKAVTGDGTIYFGLTGTGAGPMGLFTTPTASTLSSSVTEGRGISFDAAGNLYVSGYGNNAVYEITPGGTKSTATSSITEPTGTAVDGAGNLFVGSNSVDSLYEIPAGSSTASAVATISGLVDNTVVVDSAGNIYVESKTSHDVYQVAAGTFTVTQILTGGQTVTGGTLGRCIGMAIDANNNLYLADYTNNRLYKVAYGSWAVTTLVNADGNLDEPEALAIDPAGNLYVTNANDTVIRYSVGTYTANVFSTSVYTGLGSVALDASGNLYTSLDSATAIYKYTRTATPTLSFSSTAVGVTSADQIEGFENDGNAALTFSSLTGTNATFNGTDTTCSTSTPLASGSTCNFGVAFLPSTTGSPLTGDANITDNNLNASGTVQQIPVSGTATAVSTSTTVTSSANPSTYDSSVTFTATVAPTSGSAVPTGTVQFSINGSSVGSPVTLSSGTATYATSTLTLGTHSVTAAYTTNSSNYNSSSSSTFTQTVNNGPPTVTLTLSSSTIAHGTALTLTATAMSGATAVHPGVITFCDTSYSTCLYQAVVGRAQLNSSGSAAIKIVPAIGTHTYQAVFAANGSYPTATSSSASVTVTGTYTTTTTISDSGSAGDYSLTGTVASAGAYAIAPTGTVTFEDTSNSDYAVASATLGSSTVTYTLTNPGSPSTIAVSRDVAIADFNGDGVPDLAIVDQSGEKVYILLGTGNGTFTAASGSPITVSGTLLVGIAAGDFNNDGNVDLAVADYGDNKIYILLGNGNGTFQTATSITAAGEPDKIVAADFNNDGNLDLAVAECSGNAVEIFLGNGTGAFPTTYSFATGSEPYSLAAADLNGDGNIDLVAGNSGASSVTVLLGDGTGHFTQPTGSPFAAGANPSWLVIGDFNRDGKPDLAVADSGASTVDILLGNGDGTFGTATSLTALSGSKSIGMADFNADGNLDLAVCDTGTGTVDVFLGNGNGTFQTATAFSTGSTACSAVGIADFNGDGAPDVVTPMQGNNTAVIFLDKITHTATATASSVSIPGSGTHNIEAVYGGDTNDASSTSSTVGLTASKAATTLTLQASPTSSYFGQSVTLTATLSPYVIGSLTTNGETITFKNGSTTLGTGSLSGGVATLTLSTLPTATNSLTAVYATDTNFLASTSSILSFTVNKATPTITWSTPAAITYGTALGATQLNASSGGVAGGFVYSPVSGTVLGAGSQTLNVTFNPSDTTDYNSNTGSVGLTVNQATLTVTATSASRAYNTANPTFADTITGYVNGDNSSVVSGTASLTTTATLSSTVGPYTITAALGTLSAANYTFAFVNGTLTVNKATPTVSAWPTASAITYGQTLASSTLTGGTASVGGTFAWTTPGTTPGAGSPSESVTFTPSDTTDYNTPAAGSVTVTVNKATPSVSAWPTASTITYGQTLASSMLTGGTASVGGTFAWTTPSTTPGAGSPSESVTFTPSDTTDYNTPAAGSVTVTVNKSSVTVNGTTSLAVAYFGDNVTLTFTFVGSGVTPTGTTTILDGENTLGTVSLRSGVATFNMSTLSPGRHTLTAVYNGDDNYE